RPGPRLSSWRTARLAERRAFYPPCVQAKDRIPVGRARRIERCWTEPPGRSLPLGHSIPPRQPRRSASYGRLGSCRTGLLPCATRFTQPPGGLPAAVRPGVSTPTACLARLEHPRRPARTPTVPPRGGRLPCPAPSALVPTSCPRHQPSPWLPRTRRAAPPPDAFRPGRTPHNGPHALPPGRSPPPATAACPPAASVGTAAPSRPGLGWPAIRNGAPAPGHAATPAATTAPPT